MTITTSAVEMRMNLGRFLNIVLLKGDEVIIERDGKPVARLAPLASTQAKGRKTGRMDLRALRGVGKEAWQGVDVDEYIRGERETWA
jgi:antitoxin (DNA-binding transcriptional repressor) of toxin-antitoxin stability system